MLNIMCSHLTTALEAGAGAHVQVLVAPGSHGPIRYRVIDRSIDRVIDRVKT
jgi:hypothetical protein